LRKRLVSAGSEFATLVSDVARRDAWDTAFVDATCDPPVSFTFGAAVAHVLTRDSYRRQVVAAALRERGIDVAAVRSPGSERVIETSRTAATV
jgi:GNAT superfamily N-acetyltransferase